MTDTQQNPATDPTVNADGPDAATVEEFVEELEAALESEDGDEPIDALGDDVTDDGSTDTGSGAEDFDLGAMGV